jgi:HIRAN domain
MKSYSIVGQKHRGFDPYLTGTLPGTPVVLVREPGNKFDPNAVMVWIDGKHVGYIPSKDAAALAPFIDQTGTPWQEPVKMAADGVTGQIVSHPRTISAVFVRSRNSAYPQVEV